MALELLVLPLYNETYYSYSTVLEGGTYIIEMLFLERIQSWLFTLKDSEDNILVTGQRLSQDSLLLEDYQLKGLTGGFYFTRNSDKESTDSKIDKPKDFYTLYYYYESGE